MIEVHGLTKRYGSRLAVQDVSFRVERGEVVGFLGPNGAGKTTTLRMVTGFLRPTAGEVRIDGFDTAASPMQARRRIGYMPEGVPAYPEMRVTEYLRYRARLKGAPRRQLEDAVERVLDQAHVDDAADRIIGQLSKGYRQRVGLADALLTDPPILVLDEPSSGLDPNQNRDMRELVRGFAGDKTVFLSTHILPEVEATCDRIVIIQGGRKVGEGTPASLRSGGGRRIVRLVGPGQVRAFRVALQGASGVRGVISGEQGDDAASVRVEVDAGDAALDAIFDAVVAAGLRLRELVVEQTSLEEVFAHLTTTEASDAEGPGEAPEERPA